MCQQFRSPVPPDGDTVTYKYDDSGNIINRKEHLYVSEDTLGMIFSNTDFLYTVTDWGDLLTSYNGKTITYDEIGNPLSDGTWTYTWEHGRELASMTSEDTAVTYTYGADGLRLSKTVDGVTHHYVYSGGKLVEETFGNIEMQFIYDAQGYPMMVRLTRGSEQPLYYHYVVNLQGDVIRILKPNGAVCVTYQYDAWGNITRTGGPDTGLAQWNPLRYRGYVYDTETGLYYLQSRYYNPKVGRFINADNSVSSIGGELLGNNPFAYCFNNPISMIDSSGNWPKLLSKIGNAFKTAIKWTAEEIINPIVTAQKNALSKLDVTLSQGRSIGAPIGIASVSGSGYISVDTKGNIALQVSGSWSISTEPGFLTPSRTAMTMITNAPSVQKLEGEGGVVGASKFVPVEGVPLGGSGDVAIVPNTIDKDVYYGLSATAGISAAPTASALEFHAGESYTITLFSFNTYNIYNWVYSKIIGW